MHFKAPLHSKANQFCPRCITIGVAHGAAFGVEDSFQYVGVFFWVYVFKGIAYVVIGDVLHT